MEQQVQRKKALSQEDINSLLPDTIKRVMPLPDQYKLASIVKSQYDFVSVPRTGEIAYSGTSRTTGSVSALNSFYKYGYYDSSNIPLNVIDAMRRDSQMALGMAIVKYPIITLGFTIECENPVIKEFLKINFERIWYSIISSFLLSFDYGFTAFEKVWERVVMDLDPGKSQRKIKNKSFIILKKLKPLAPTTISLTTDGLNNFMGVNQQSFGNKKIEMNRTKSMIFTYQEEFGNFFGKSRMVSAYEPWYWKLIANQFFLRWMERRSIPPYAIRFPIGQTVTSAGQQANNDLAMAMAQAIGAYGNIVIPSKRDANGNLEWDINSVDQGQSQITLKDILEDVYNIAILRGLLIPDKKSLSGMSDVAVSKFFLSTHEDFVKNAEEKINEELVKPLVYWNFPKDMIVPVRLNIDDIDFEKREEMRKLLSKMWDMSATYIKNLNGLPFNVMPDIAKIYEILDIPSKEAANYQLKVIDTDGNIVKQTQPINKPNNKGPEKGEITSGNLSREGRDGTPRDEDKDDESNA